MNEADIYIDATVTDRWGGVETIYAGSMPDWAWADPDHTAEWKRVRSALILEDRTSDPRGWRVTFAAADADRCAEAQ